MMRVTLSLIVVMVLAVNMSGAGAQDAPPVPEQSGSPKARSILVLDASGSMWGQIDGQNKIVIAREVVADLMSTWDPEIHLGLTAYGHNRKGDCADIEALVPVGQGTMVKITEIVNGINPKGKTPLSEAVRQAADSLKYTEEAATVILVTDGLETCDADPCAVSKALEESGIDFTAHVVGFDITEDESKQIRCIAENTGGQYFSAGNATELRDALGSVVQVVQESVATDTIHVILAEGQDPIQDGGTGFQYFRAEDADNPDRKYVAYGYGEKGYPKLQPGNYVAQVKLGATIVDAPFEVLEDERREHVVNLNAGRLKVSARLDEKSGQTEGKLGWEVFLIGDNGEPAKKQITYAYGDTPNFVLPAGNYLIRVKRGSAVAEATQLITAGENHELVIDLRAGELSFNAILHEGASPYDGSMGWTAHVIDENGVRAKKNAAYSYGASGTYTLTAGRYALKAKAGSIERWVEVDVPAGEKVSTTVLLDGGVLAYDASLTQDGEPVTSGSLGWSAYAVGKDGNVASKQIAYSYGVSGNYVLPTGDYELKVKVGAIERLQRASVSAGGNTKVRVNLDGGYAQYEIVDANGAPAPGSTGWLIRPVQNGFVSKANSAYGYNNAGTATLPTGSYEFSVDSQGIIGATQFDVKAGETVNVTVETVPKP